MMRLTTKLKSIIPLTQTEAMNIYTYIMKIKHTYSNISNRPTPNNTMKRR